MKKIIFAAALIVSATTAFVACKSEDEPVVPKGEITSITLSVDKNTIEANGQDAVQFTVIANTGEDLTGKEGVRIMIPATKTFLDGMKYTSTVDGPVTFQARYSGILSNEETVTVQNRSKYEKYLRRVVISQLTGTWCVNCPNMTSALKTVSAELPGRIEVLAFHGSSGGSNIDPYAIDATAKLLSKFNLSGYPSAVIDMRKAASGSSATYLMVEVDESLKNYPATCGVKIESTYDKSTKKASVKISVAASKTNTYTLGYAVVVDGLTEPQTGADEDYVHNNVVIGINNINGEMIGEIKENEEWSQTFEVTAGTKYDVANMRVVAYASAKIAGEDTYYINNAASCKLDGGSVDYIYNE